MNDKADVKESLERLMNQYLIAKQNGDTKLMKQIGAIILRLGGKIPKL